MFSQKKFSKRIFGRSLSRSNPTQENPSQENPVPTGHQKRRSTGLAWPVLTCLAALLTLALLAPPVSADKPLKGPNVLSAFYLDIGQGDATLLRTPSGKFIL